MEDAMPRRGARTRRNRALRRRLDPARHRVEAKHEGAVEAFVGHDNVATSWIEDHGVRMRRFLLHRIRPWLPREFIKLMHRQQPPIGLQRQYRDGATAVIRNHQMAPAGIQRRVHRVVALAGHAAQHPQMAGFGGDGEGSQMISAAMHGV